MITQFLSNDDSVSLKEKRISLKEVDRFFERKKNFFERS
jgi:hypothetical protein